MNIGIGMGLSRSRGRGTSLFNPLILSPLWWLDFSAISTLFRDSDRTIPITSDNQKVMGITDKSGNGYHFKGLLDVLSPAYKTNVQNGLSMVLYDGVDDALESISNVGHDVGTGDFYFATVYKHDVSGAFSSLWSNGAYTPTIAAIPNGIQSYWGGYINFSGTYVSGVAHSLEFYRQSGVIKATVDGNSDPVTSSVASVLLNEIHRLGSDTAGGEFFLGYIGEALFCSGLPSVAYRNGLISSWRTKWSTP